MSELINTNDNRVTIRWKLLTGASALALSASTFCVAKAEEADRPQVWIELGGQLERLNGQPSVLISPFFALASPQSVQTMTDAQRPSFWAIGGEGKITLTPEGTNWLFLSAIRYGRSNSSRHLHYQADFPSVEKYLLPFIQPTTLPLARAKFSDAEARSEENHTVIDFMAGKDVGLGMFGANGTSVVSAGVRFAQFVSKGNTALYARPVEEANLRTPIPGKYKWDHPLYQTYTAVLRADRSTHAFGPSLSWEASMPMAGNDADSELTFDWGVNGALLFGRRRANIHHQTTSNYYYRFFGSQYIGRQTTHTVNRKDSRTAVIPNVGGFAGISLKFPNAKVSIGYRGDFFFGAVDGGIDAAKKEDRGFHGPYASVSIGIGD